MKKTIQLGRKPTLMKCTEHDCYEMYPSWALLARHIKQSHYGEHLLPQTKHTCHSKMISYCMGIHGLDTLIASGLRDYITELNYYYL